MLLAATILLSPVTFPGSAGAQSTPRLALVTRTIPVPDADQAYVQHFSQRGWNVTLVDDDAVRANGQNAISGYDLVVISSTVYPQRIQGRLRDAPEPIIVAEHQLFTAFGLATNRGLTDSISKLDIARPNHPLAAGLNGTVSVASKAKPMNFGTAGQDAHVIATAQGSAEKAVIFAYEAGDTLANGQRARGPRVAFYMSQAYPRFTNREGSALLEAAATWAAANAPAQEDGDGNKQTTSIAPAAGTLLGANVSKESFPSRYEAVRGFERQIRRDLDIVNRFHEFSAGVTSNFFWDRRHIEDGRTVMISWRATDNAGSTQGQPDPQRARKIVAGQFDRQIKAMATALRDLKAPVLLRFNWEMDQSVGDPQYIGTPQEFIAAWRYVHRIFENQGASNVEWVWAPRARSFAKGVGQTFYPGYEYVDWIGGSAVPINSFTDAQTIYSAWNQWAASIGKPQFLWIGLRENPNDARWKSQFINEIRNLAGSQWSGLKAVMYYSSKSPRGFDYTTDTSSASLSAFRQLACDPQFTTVNGC